MSSDKQFYRGRILVTYGKSCIVEDTNQDLIRCSFRRKSIQSVCNDTVLFERIDSKTGVIDSIDNRKNHFDRADSRKKRQMIAANLDQILVVVAAKPAPSNTIIDAYLTACYQLNISPVILVNKSDLDSYQDADFQQVIKTYSALSYPLISVSAKFDQRIDQLTALLTQKTSILVGQSGVGKSSLVNSLIPDKELRTAELSDATGKGTHTTTATQYHPLPDGGGLIDSPGVWEYGIWAMSESEIAEGFREFQEFETSCHYHNCRHISEPKCGVKDAVDTGQILSRRYQSYLNLVRLAQT